jgi:hypothetical protein
MKSKRIVFSVMASVVFFWTASAIAADESLLDSVVQGCMTELETYCKDVTPGQKRVLACLYAHGDKLSGKCEYALYDAAVQLERAVAALSYVVNECADDLEKFCSKVEVGEGRLLACLDEHAPDVSARCKDAIAEVIVR